MGSITCPNCIVRLDIGNKNHYNQSTLSFSPFQQNHTTIFQKVTMRLMSIWQQPTEIQPKQPTFGKKRNDEANVEKIDSENISDKKICHKGVKVCENMLAEKQKFKHTHTQTHEMHSCTNEIPQKQTIAVSKHTNK